MAGLIHNKVEIKRVKPQHDELITNFKFDNSTTMLLKIAIV